MDAHTRKKFAPVIITILVLIYYGIYFGFLISMVPGIWKLLLCIVPALLGGAMIYVCILRIREIDGGEEDDLSQY